MMPIPSPEAGEARRAALEECAALADAYEQENLAMCGDSIMNDPILKKARGRVLVGATPDDWEASKKFQMDGAIHSAQAMAARNLAAMFRARAALTERKT